MSSISFAISCQFSPNRSEISLSPPHVENAETKARFRYFVVVISFIMPWVVKKRGE